VADVGFVWGIWVPYSVESTFVLCTASQTHLIFTAMKVFQSWGLALSITTLLFGSAQASLDRRYDTGPSPEQLVNQKRSFSLGIVCWPIALMCSLLSMARSLTRLLGLRIDRLPRMGTTRCFWAVGDLLPGIDEIQFTEKEIWTNMSC
jgi:hypothetical protein